LKAALRSTETKAAKNAKGCKQLSLSYHIPSMVSSTTTFAWICDDKFEQTHTTADLSIQVSQSIFAASAATGGNLITVALIYKPPVAAE
jgi:hypothetical protein